MSNKEKIQELEMDIQYQQSKLNYCKNQEQKNKVLSEIEHLEGKVIRLKKYDGNKGWIMSDDYLKILENQKKYNNLQDNGYKLPL